MWGVLEVQPTLFSDFRYLQNRRGGVVAHQMQVALCKGRDRYDAIVAFMPTLHSDD